jgi:thiol-disulfide isomerase/thioredoxin
MKQLGLSIAIALIIFTAKAQTPLTTALDFTVTTVEGNSFNLFNTLAANKYVCIDFFYYGCVPCQQTAPKVNGAYEHFGCNSSNVVFIGIDNGDNTATTIAFGNNFGADYPAASGTDGGGNAVASAYGIGAYPTVILIAPNHSIVEQDIWPIADAAALYAIIQGHGGIPANCPSAGIASDVASITGIYPNPASEKTTIDVNLTEIAEIYLKIYSITGQEVKSVTVSNAGIGINTIPLSLDELSNGLYIIKLIDKNKVLAQSKLSVIK